MSGLYGDIKLGNDDLENVAFKEKYEALKEEHDRDSKELHSLREEVERLRKQNEILERNICCLYETAKAEIRRKDLVIKDMRSQLTQVRLQQQND